MLDPGELPLVALFALPLGIVGVMARAGGRRAVERARQTRAARRRIRDLAPGVVVVEGTWRALGGARGVIEDDGGAVVIDRGAGATVIADGARVLCQGVARGDAPDPRGGGYRGAGRLPVIDATGCGDFVTTDLDGVERAVTVGQRKAMLGMLLVACAVALLVAGFALWLQVTVD